MRIGDATPLGLRIGSLVVVIFLIIAIAMWQGKSNRNRIHSWCEDNQCQVVEIDEKWTAIGSPFWYKDDDQRIYRVEVKDKLERDRVVWFRIGWWLKAVWE